MSCKCKNYLTSICKPKNKIDCIAWLLLNVFGCKFCETCRDKPCNIKDGELCTDKPFEVQEQDIANFSRDISLIKELITSQEQRIGELTEENERLRDTAYRLECEVHRERADTVRKMQERFIAEIEQTPNANEHFIKAWKSKIDQIAKEMLEGV